MKFNWTIVRKDIEIPLEIEGDGYYTPGVYTRRPEDCYPEESDAEILSVRLWDGRPLPKAVALTKNEVSDIRSHILDEVRSGSGSYESEPDDYDYGDVYDPY